MKQLDIFAFQPTVEAPLLQKKEKKTLWKLFVDGAARKNPGEAGAGICVFANEMNVFCKGYYLGHKTNNQAEYLALLLGIFYCKKHILTENVLSIVSDSELLVKQMKGIYKIKNVELKKYSDVAFMMLADMKYNFMHVMREMNHEADTMANEGIDKRTHPPKDFLAILKKYEISI